MVIPIEKQVLGISISTFTYIHTYNHTWKELVIEHDTSAAEINHDVPITQTKMLMDIYIHTNNLIMLALKIVGVVQSTIMDENFARRR
jgi:hypothetical protein